ncbi:ParB/RepB/Spo0J family partition protein [Streptomyces sp. NPDC087659]|uniref:ParB/RepB/Spo0J family partition protein n=1 Tax=Streptomyces sp. NPDC087659 TaxID=3365801 RepID=UPI0038210B7E
MSGLEDEDLDGSTADLFGIDTSFDAGRAAGLGSLLRSPVAQAGGEDQPTPAGGRPAARWIPITRCAGNPRNPREDSGDLSDLQSIGEKQLSSCTGVTPAAYLKLWPEDSGKIPGDAEVVLIAGNRRLKASHKFGRDKLLVVTDDSIAESKAKLLRAAYDENTGRLDFDPIEDAKAALLIVEQYPTAKEACAAEGWTTSWVSQRRALLRLHPALQALVRSKARGGDGLSVRKARWLGARPYIEELDPDEQLALLANYMEDGAHRKRKSKSEALEPASGAKIPAPAGERFSAVDRDTYPQPKTGTDTSGSEPEPESFTAVNRKLSADQTARVATTSAINVLRQLANSLVGLPVPTDRDVVDRAREEDPESAEQELSRIKDWVHALEELISRS